MMRLHILQKIFYILFLTFIAGLLFGCKRHGTSSSEGDFSSTVEPMDNDPSDTFVRNVYINDRWVGSAGPGGSGVVNGIQLPIKWHSGLTAHVRWERCEPFAKNCKWHELDAPITKYVSVGMTHLHIMQGDKEVLIIPSMLAPSHPKYPGPGYPDKNFNDTDHSEEK